MQERTAPSSWGEEGSGAEGTNKEPKWCGSSRSPPAHAGTPGRVPAPVEAFSPPASPLSAALVDVGRESCANAVRCAGAQDAARGDAAALGCRDVSTLLRTSEGWEREREK